MKEKFAAFLVERRKIILIVFIMLAVAFGCMIPFVNVNYDMAKYLPENSSMKKGMDIMEAEFGKEESSNLEIMFNDLKGQKQKNDILKELKKIRYVDDTEYEAGDSAYNRDGHTLYKITCEYDQYSDEAKAILDTVKEKYEESHDITLGGSTHTADTAGLPLWIAATAVALIFLIILIMASSWIEPLPMLITIAIAVLINMGSYVFFSSISNTTFGIVAILQLALSMDYSIMLMNRYRQQRAVSDKIKAMKDSLALSFGAISGSSLTTFAGLLALVFMSFKMGTDIGLALAKGVIISLICIFTVLQALIVTFDGLMLKTPKKTMKFHYPKLSRFQFRFRIPITILFIIIFGISFIAKGNVDYTYAQNTETEIDKVFGYDNTIVMIYNTDDGAKAGQLAEKLEKNDAVKSAACYEGTIGKERTANDMHSFICDMAESQNESNVDIDPDLIRLIYYDYHAGDDDFGLTIPQFVDFLQNEVIRDENFKDSIDKNARDKINEMARMTDRSKLIKPMNAAGLASFFGMKKSQVEQLLLYYEIKRGNAKAGRMSLPQFVNFLVDDLSKDKTYGKMIDKKSLKLLKAMQVFTNKDLMTMPADYRTAAKYTGVDEETMLYFYTLYFAESGLDPATATLTAQEVINFLITDERVISLLTEEQLKQMQQLAGIINISVSGQKLSAGQMAKLLGMKKSDVRSIYLIYKYRKGQTGSWKLSPQQFINFLVKDVMRDKSMKKQMAGSVKELIFARTMINHVVAGTKFTASEMADLFSGYSDDMDAGSISMIYKLYGSKHRYDESWTMNLCSMIEHLDEEILQNPAYSKAIDADQKKDVSEMRKELEDGAALLEGENYGRMIITADLEEDSDETRTFMDELTDYADQQFSSDCYFIGNTPMAYEMSGTFKKELNKITLITALFIFIIVLITFRNLATPVILVLIIQCAVYVTMGVMSLIHFDMNYLALLIVQSIMMGATIDYAIIFTSYYIEHRERLPRADSIRESFRGSMQTILTSATILIVAVGILSFAFSEVATRQICRILSAGCLTATLLVIFILPAILACLDRLIVRNGTGGRSQ